MPPEIVIPEAVVVDRPKDTYCPTAISPSAPEPAGAMYPTLPEPDTLTSALADAAPNTAARAESAIVSFFHNNYSFLN